jgi:hypothetical protein
VSANALNLMLYAHWCRVERVEQDRTEQELLFRRLKPFDAGYDLERRCMEGTRKSILSRILDWVTNPHGKSGAPRRNTYWLYGLPGVGKSAVAHSLCEELHQRKHLAGAFFCRRDDKNLSDPKNILPTLIYNLAMTFPPFRSIVAERLHNDVNLTSKSMEHSLFLDFIGKLPHHPEHSLVLVIDALDECGDRRSRPGILSAVIDAAAQAPWLKIIITSRPEVDIFRFFDAPSRPPHSRYDLGTDEEAGADLRAFAQSEFDMVAADWSLSLPWPEESLFDRAISRAKGLFIFIKTIVRALESCKDPTEAIEALEATLEVSDATSLDPLYGLYTNILKARIAPKDTEPQPITPEYTEPQPITPENTEPQPITPKNTEPQQIARKNTEPQRIARKNTELQRMVPMNKELQRIIGVVLATAPYRSLPEDAIATLAGLKPSVVKKWVEDLSALFYRDEAAKGGIRVRHMSISDFFLNKDRTSDYQIDLNAANMDLGIACMRTMVDQLRFNICNLEDSRVANEDVPDLQSRIEENIPVALQYSSLYWSHHICFTPDNDDQRVWGSLKTFFEGPYPLYWVEVLSIMRMVSIGAPSLRRVVSWARVSGAPAWYSIVFQADVTVL